MPFRHALWFLALLAACLNSAVAQVAGQALPAWTPGTLDIHHISTGRGNATLLILPDGTTALVDAGALQPDYSPRSVSPRPDASRTPGEWIARYIRHMLAYQASPALDYALVTHFHADHMGIVTEDTKTAKNGRYKISGLTEVAEYVPMRKIIDRAWPDYNWPQPLTDEFVNNYRVFLEWQRQHNGLRVERFRPGRNDQIVLLRAPQSYPAFEVRNIAASGEVWTGVGTSTRQHFPRVQDLQKPDLPTENMCSIALRVSYGKFDYFTGGDITSSKDDGEPPWRDIERPVAMAVGPVDVYQLNHHGHYDSNSLFFISILRPRVHVMPIWSAAQPDRHVLRKLLFPYAYPGPRDVFATAFTEANAAVLADWIGQLKAREGHIVVRVAPGGDTYQVVVLDNRAETYRVTAIHGPYESR
jgi:beta-lactamase superfamily II metal-dependent hydrolase